jgi:hypothetical protein
MDYDFWLRSERKCANNTAVKYIKNFKKIIRLCMANGWLSKDPFLGYKAKLKVVERPYLTKEEIQAVYEKGLYFDETITQLEKEKLLVLDIKTDPHKIPPTVMDEHQ